ncbi:hypothetical protein [Halomicrobium salinisoli]|uniref:hypothetical protein n=1 Tax=Halomicrobium salinisoli TaxID=2878391 RepID=UPI001CF00263|nr:hypothetical protein [Halomicrobium salinisoli]
MTGNTDAADVDPEHLERQLGDIKEAMGLAERYPGRPRLWLVAGVLIGVAALLTQAAYFYYETLSGTAYAAIWFGFLAVAVGATWYTARGLPTAEPPTNVPSWRAVFGSLLVFLLALSSLGGRATDGLAGLERATFFFGALIAAVGLGLLLTGAVLAAYRVRRRDRLPFYAGGCWVLAYAFVLPHVQWLRWIGVGLFGVLFVAYAVATWIYLRE